MKIEISFHSKAILRRKPTRFLCNGRKTPGNRRTYDITWDRFEIRRIKIKFSIFDCDSIYNGILERPPLANLGVVLSIVHLKIKFQTMKDQIIVLEADSPFIRPYNLAFHTKQIDSDDAHEEYEETLELNSRL